MQHMSTDVMLEVGLVLCMLFVMQSNQHTVNGPHLLCLDTASLFCSMDLESAIQSNALLPSPNFATAQPDWILSVTSMQCTV
jgi:hypothetical protein